jgi:hypothetical protein
LGHHLGQLDASAATVLTSEDEASGTALHDDINERTNIAQKSLGIGIVPPADRASLLIVIIPHNLGKAVSCLPTPAKNARRKLSGGTV